MLAEVAPLLVNSSGEVGAAVLSGLDLLGVEPMGWIGVEMGILLSRCWREVWSFADLQTQARMQWTAEGVGERTRAYCKRERWLWTTAVRVEDDGWQELWEWARVF